MPLKPLVARDVATADGGKDRTKGLLSATRNPNHRQHKQQQTNGREKTQRVLHSSKNNDKIRRQPTGWGKILSSCTSDKISK